MYIWEIVPLLQGSVLCRYRRDVKGEARGYRKGSQSGKSSSLTWEYSGFREDHNNHAVGDENIDNGSEDADYDSEDEDKYEN